MKATDIPARVRRDVHERDRGCCRLCGKAGPVEQHHIIYRSQARNLHTPENLIELCFPHHRLAHTRPVLIRPALQAEVDKPWLTGLAWLRQQGHDLRGLGKGTL